MFDKNNEKYLEFLVKNNNQELRHQIRHNYQRNQNEINPTDNNNSRLRIIGNMITSTNNSRRPESHRKDEKRDISEEIRDIKGDISIIKELLRNINKPKNNDDASEIVNIKQENEELKKEIKSLKEELSNIKNILNDCIKIEDIKSGKYTFEITDSDIEPETEYKTKKIPDRKVIIEMFGKTHMLKIHDKITLKEFISRSYQSFDLSDTEGIDIYYFNKFGKKITIKDEKDFENSLEKKIPKYYIRESKKLINSLTYAYLIKNDENNKDLKKNFTILNVVKENIEEYKENNKNVVDDKNNECDIDEKMDELDEEGNKNNNHKENIDNNKYNYSNENNLEDAKKIEKPQYYINEQIIHFASMAQNEIENKIEYFLNSADCISDFMNKYNPQKKSKYPSKFIDSHKVIQKPGLLSEENTNKNDFDFILSLLAEILKDKKIDLSIYKDLDTKDNKKEKLSDACLQYLFCGLFDKKKIEINFKLESNIIEILNKKEKDLSNFIDEWKEKIANKLNIKKEEISLINPKKKQDGTFSLDLVSNDDSIFKVDINNIFNFNEINYIQEKSFIESCQLNNNIFEPRYNNQDGFWGCYETRGGEDYIPPIGWKGYGLKVKGKYDFGDDTWLDYKDRKGVFAVAYLGISNIFGNEQKLKKYISEVDIPEILKMNYEQTYKNDNDLRNPRKKCDCGVYLYQNPKIAENSAGIIDIYGVRYKVLLMCRVNPKKIRQPKGFKDCWILNPTPDEIRPYRILVKTIINSPLAGASQQEFKFFTEPSPYYNNIIKNKDFSFFEKNKTDYSNNHYVINLYTQQYYRYINNYLRSGRVTESPYTEAEIKSWVMCLHDALTNRKSNVNNSSTIFRGISDTFPDQLEKGSKFILGEFVSTSRSLKVSLFFGAKTLFIIRIENNNNPPGYYCYDIEKYSEIPDEEEILITSNCVFQITNKVKKSIKKLKEEFGITEDLLFDENLEILTIYLTCLGNFYDIQKEVINN